MTGTPTLTARSQKQSEWDTPIVSAIVTSAGLLVMWTIILVLWLHKRGKKRRRVRRARRDPVKAAALKAKMDAKKAAQEAAHTYIVPPDPAILLGQRQPGDGAFLASHGSIELEETGQKESTTPNSFEDPAKDLYKGDLEAQPRSHPVM
ncbi:hypothetical protein FA95DRAFT_1554089 [Auriscalpium vulgare]|uniref:Uncharacterized protein n=1 Tax=Auriscalpium vulgare TaxID=40419 RepID=A0ACB8S674_9AGAM|nr:hypothetical protein FA95DRAFT_1554089 [Auriscalpium vulgare]